MNISLDKEDLSSKPPKPLGDKSTSLDFKRSEEEKIFQATDSLFSTKSLNLFSSKEKNEIEKDEEEEQKVEFEGTHEEEIGKIFEGLKGEEGLHVVTTSIRPTTMKTASSNFKVKMFNNGYPPSPVTNQNLKMNDPRRNPLIFTKNSTSSSERIISVQQTYI